MRSLVLINVLAIVEVSLGRFNVARVSGVGKETRKTTLTFPCHY
jgi:hypothetical protein